MRVLLTVILALLVSELPAQNDSIAGGVYSWNNARTEKTKTGERKKYLPEAPLILLTWRYIRYRLNLGSLPVAMKLTATWKNWSSLKRAIFPSL